MTENRWGAGIDIFCRRHMFCAVIVPEPMGHDRRIRRYTICSDGIRGLTDWLSGMREKYGPANICVEAAGTRHAPVIHALRSGFNPVLVNPETLRIAGGRHTAYDAFILARLALADQEVCHDN